MVLQVMNKGCVPLIPYMSLVQVPILKGLNPLCHALVTIRLCKQCPIAACAGAPLDRRNATGDISSTTLNGSADSVKDPWKRRLMEEV